MQHPRRLILSIARPCIEDARDLRRYVMWVTGLSILLAVGLDVVNQAIFAESWMEAFRSWAISAFLAFIVAFPVSRRMGQAYLELYRAKVSVEALSRTDSLTGLLNRRALVERDAQPPHVLALVIVDIDRFKRINDRHGHLVGDDVIRTVAQIMQRRLGTTGAIGRLGGEEFALLSSESDIDRLTADIAAFLDEVGNTAIVSAATSVRVTVSAGIAPRLPGQSFEQLYAEADRALYLAKSAGRNRFVRADQVAPADLPGPMARRLAS